MAIANDYLDHIGRFSANDRPSRMEELMQKLGNPQDKLKFVHVAGTNGKGSTCVMTAGALQMAGYRTGLYLSPHVSDFTERIQVNSIPIDRATLDALTMRVKAAVEAICEGENDRYCQFDLVTAIALCYFWEQRCDIVVLEVGLGGRKDATNVIKTPVVDVITRIDYDHMQVLGHTLTEIAGEKCGILRKGVPVICYPDQPEEALKTIKKAVNMYNNEIIIPNVKNIDQIHSNMSGTDFSYEGISLHVPFLGEYQIDNAVTAVETLRVLRKAGFTMTDEQMRDGIGAAKIPARMEVLCDEPLMILDGGHNPSAMQELAKWLDGMGARRVFAIFGMSADKEVEKSLQIIAPYLHRLVAVPFDSERSMDTVELYTIASRNCQCLVEAYCDLQEAYYDTLDEMDDADLLLISGSFYLAGQMKQIVLDSIEEVEEGENEE